MTPIRILVLLLVFLMVIGLFSLTAPGLAPAALAMPASQNASHRYVQVGGNDTGSCTDPAHPCGTIAYALNVSFAGSQTLSDTINISPGHYPQPATLTITKYIILQGTSADGTAAQIDGQGLNRVIQANAPRLTINNLTIQNGNAGSEVGGGINVSGTSAVTIRNSYIVNNHAAEGGGISGGSNSAVFVTRSSFSNNLASTGRGGAILDGVGSTTTITASAIISNSAVDGGGIFNQSSLSIVNSTLSDNSVSGNGGGVNTTGSTGLSNVTLFNNAAGSNGGGIYAGGGGSVTLRNTILAGNTSGGDSPDCSGPIGSQGFNLIGNNTGCTFSPDVNDTLVGTGDTPIIPQLGPLTSYGSYTMYRLPQTGSPAIDAGNNTTGCADGGGNLLTVDQRNTVRPQNGRCDIGATEVGNAPGLSTINPDTSMAASGGFQMTLTGLNFHTSNPQVLWHRNGVTTTYTTVDMSSHSTTQILLNVPGGAILSPGTALVSVQNPPGGPGYVSGALPFTIEVNPAQLIEYLPYISK